jgi:hypothetical protein
MRWWVGMGKRKYRLLPPSQVAEQAWSELTNTEKIKDMKTNYADAMDKLPTDADAKARYTGGVAGWTETMRTPEIRDTIMKAIGKAKSLFLRKRFGITPTPAT